MAENQHKTKEQLDLELLTAVHTLTSDEEIKIRKGKDGKLKTIVVTAQRTTILQYE
jgi:hypothetical protein